MPVFNKYFKNKTIMQNHQENLVLIYHMYLIFYIN